MRRIMTQCYNGWIVAGTHIHRTESLRLARMAQSWSTVKFPSCLIFNNVPSTSNFLAGAKVSSHADFLLACVQLVIYFTVDFQLQTKSLFRVKVHCHV